MSLAARLTKAPARATLGQGKGLQRRCACGGVAGPGGECSACRARRLARQQALRDSTPGHECGLLPANVYDTLAAPGRPLDAAIRALMEPRFGHDFGHVRVHTDARAGESARAVNALAYTVGRNVVFGAGQYAPATPAGRRLIAHELTHVIQQSGTPGILPRAALTVSDPQDAAEREADTVAAQVLSGRAMGSVARVMPSVQRVKEPYISNVAVDLSPPESASLEWKGTPPADAPGEDSFTVSTGKGYSDPDDEPGTCSRTCCGGAETQCAPPWDEPKKLGACCTPVGTFYTGTPRKQHNGWNWWTPVEPVHTKYGRGIALHQHTEVTGQAIGHGCIRMDEDNAHRIYLYTRGANTKVTISGRAKVSCPPDRQCAASGSTGAMNLSDESENSAVATLSAPDNENPGSEGAPPGPDILVPENAAFA